MTKLHLKHRIDRVPANASAPSSMLKSSADGEIAFTVTNSSHDPELYGGVAGRLGYGINNRAGAGAVDRIGLMACPKGTRLQIQRSQEWREDDELINKLVDVQVEFASIGMSVRCKQPEGSSLETILSSGNKTIKDTGNEIIKDEATVLDKMPDSQKAELLAIIKFQQNLNNIQAKWDLDGLVEDLLRDWFTTDSMILYWKVEKNESGTNLDSDTDIPVISQRSELLPGVVNICALNPAEADWDNTLGVDRMKVLIGEKLKKRIQAAISRKVGSERNKAIESLLSEGIEKKWIEAVDNGKDWVQLSNEDGEYWVIKTKARRQNGLATPSMKTVFLPLESRKALREGDFAASFMMKHFILQITAGESISGGGPLGGSKQNWVTPKDTEGLLNMVTNISRASRIATNHTVKFNFVFPPKEMFDPAKFFKIESQIYTWADVTVAIMSGGGESGDSQKSGTGFIGIKKLVAKLQKARKVINWVMQEFFGHETIQPKILAPEQCQTALTFDENALKEGRQLLDEIKFLVSTGIEDARTAARELGRNPDSLYIGKLQTLAENAEIGVWEPIVGTPGAQFHIDGPGKHGRTDNDKGRPPRDNTTLTEETRTNTGTP